MDRQQLYLYLIIKELEKNLGIKFDLGDPLDRLMAQKIVYLLQAKGLYLGYFFQWSPY